MMKLILASNSPRRKQFLKDNNYDFTVVPSNYNETDKFTDPYLMAVNFSFYKAMDVWKRCEQKDSLVLGSDTVVCCDNNILGKPVDQNDAINMLKFLSGKKHLVISGYAIITKDETYTGYDETEVEFNSLSDEEIFNYIKSGLYRGKAGSYGIQDGFNLVKSYKGSLDNVIGLPTEKIFPILDKYMK